MHTTNVCLVLSILVVADRATAQQLDPGAIRAAANYSANHRGASLLVIEKGKTLLEEYPGGGSRDTPRKIYSGTKAFWNLAALAAAEDGLEPGFLLHGRDPGDRDAIAIKLPLVADPGAAFVYGPSALQVFHRLLKAKLRGEAPKHYLERRVLRRLGLGPQRYLQDRAGNPLLAAGWQLTARQWAKLGKLVLAHGAPVVSSRSLAECWRGSAANPAFSLGWWNNRAAPMGRDADFERVLNSKGENWDGICLCRDAPSDLVACIGSGHQRLYVIPSLQLIVVRHSSGGSFSDATFLRLLLGWKRG
ncbi:MAG: serine hydrolase [Verrucomicrobia bacterium]|nr:MAG: serine hydrolase [Verrucomicrobiota bacterium]